MVAAKAEWLYELPQWEAIFDETQLEAYKQNPKLFDYFVGQVMKKTRGKANPAMTAKLLKQELDK